MGFHEPKESAKKLQIFITASKYNINDPLKHEIDEFYNHNIMKFLRSLDLDKYIEFVNLWGVQENNRISISEHRFRTKIIQKTSNHRLDIGGFVNPSLVNCMLNHFGLLRKVNRIHGIIPHAIYKNQLRSIYARRKNFTGRASK